MLPLNNYVKNESLNIWINKELRITGRVLKAIIDRVCEDYDGLWQARSRILNSKIVIMMILRLF